jgi:hypothetical protein
VSPEFARIHALAFGLCEKDKAAEPWRLFVDLRGFIKRKSADINIILDHPTWDRISAAFPKWIANSWSQAFVDMIAANLPDPKCASVIERLTEFAFAEKACFSSPVALNLLQNGISATVMEKCRKFVTASSQAVLRKWGDNKDFFVAVNLIRTIGPNAAPLCAPVVEAIESVIDRQLPAGETLRELGELLIEIGKLGGEEMVQSICCHARERFIGNELAIYATVLGGLIVGEESFDDLVIVALSLVDTRDRMKLVSAFTAALQPWLATERAGLVKQVVLQALDPEFIQWGVTVQKDLSSFFVELIQLLSIDEAKDLIVKIFGDKQKLDAYQWRMARDLVVIFSEDMDAFREVFPVKVRPSVGDKELNAIYDVIFSP